MNFISLFSGIGGFDLGFERAGMKSVAVCDIDKHALGKLAEHFPHAEQFDDVRKIGENTHERGSVDLICGGFPCQDVSIAGKRKGLAGERSGLWFEFARVVGELNPRRVVIENVPGLLSSNKGRDMEAIVRALVKLGYGVAWRVLDSQYFGVPQRRRRVFIVASLGSGCAAKVLFESESGAWHTPPSREAGQGVADRVTPSIVSNGDGHTGFRDEKGLVIAFNHQSGGDFRPQPSVDQANTLQVHQRQAIAFNYDQSAKTRSMGEAVEQSPTLRSCGGIAVMSSGQANAEITKDISPSLTGLHEQPIVWHENQGGNLAIDKDGIAKALKANASHSYQGVGVRRLTPLECERLQGFPDGWTDGQSDTQRYKQLGNAVTVNVAEWLGKRIVDQECFT